MIALQSWQMAIRPLIVLNMDLFFHDRTAITADGHPAADCPEYGLVFSMIAPQSRLPCFPDALSKG